MIGALTPVTFLLGGKFYRSIGLLMRRYYGLCSPGDEGVFWCRGWWRKNVAALRVAHALRASTALPPHGYTVLKLAIRGLPLV